MMTWRGTKVLVNGAEGFIGSHLTEALVSSGADVTGLVLYNSFGQSGWLDDLDPQILGGLRTDFGDIRDPHKMLNLCKGQEVIFHLAALISIPYSYEAVSHYLQTNVMGTNNVLQAALTAGVGKVVHTSTSEVYGTAQFVPISEGHPLQAQSPYAASKIGADKLAESYHRSFGLPVTTLRPFNTYGPRQSERAVISSIIRQAIDSRSENISIGDTTPKRDFMYVGNTVEAFLSLGSADEAVDGQVYNAGTNNMVSIGDVLEQIVSLTDTALPVVQSEQRMRPADSEVFALQADYSKLQAATGWQPTIDLSTGLANTIDWWKSHTGQAGNSLGYLY